METKSSQYLELDSGLKLHFVDEGQGPVTIFVHGNPTSSFFFRNLIQPLSKDFRCIAPDHIGCGLSDKPDHSTPYSIEQHIKNLKALINSLNIKEFNLVVHDWGGVIGLGTALEFPQRIKKLVILNTAAFPDTVIPLRIQCLRWPVFKQLLLKKLGVFEKAATFMAPAKPISSEIRNGYLRPFNENNAGVCRFVESIPLSSSHPSFETLKFIEDNLYQLQETPKLICWGGKDFCFSEHYFEEWMHRLKPQKYLYLKQSGHYLLEDNPQLILDSLQKFL